MSIRNDHLFYNLIIVSLKDFTVRVNRSGWYLVNGDLVFRNVHVDQNKTYCASLEIVEDNKAVSTEQY